MGHEVFVRDRVRKLAVLYPLRIGCCGCSVNIYHLEIDAHIIESCLQCVNAVVDSIFHSVKTDKHRFVRVALGRGRVGLHIREDAYGYHSGQLLVAGGRSGGAGLAGFTGGSGFSLYPLDSLDSLLALGDGRAGLNRSRLAGAGADLRDRLAYRAWLRTNLPAPLCPSGVPLSLKYVALHDSSQECRNDLCGDDGDSHGAQVGIRSHAVLCAARRDDP